MGYINKIKRKGVFIMAIRIVLNTGEEIVGEVGSYDALDLAKQLNNNQIMFYHAPPQRRPFPQFSAHALPLVSKSK